MTGRNALDEPCRRPAAGSVSLFVALLVLSLLGGSLGAGLAYYTLSWSHSLLLFFGVGLVALGSTATYLMGRRRTAAGMLFIAALLIVSWQAHLGHRWIELHRESGRLLAFLYEKRFHEGAFPAELSGYEFQRPELAQFFTYLPTADGEMFLLGYSIGTRSTSHLYSSQSGWHYAAD